MPIQYLSSASFPNLSYIVCIKILTIFRDIVAGRKKQCVHSELPDTSGHGLKTPVEAAGRTGMILVTTYLYVSVTTMQLRRGTYFGVCFVQMC